MSISHLEGVNPPRLCLIKKRPDFQGYGFNLQAEKGKPGQFIGNVDPGSPAERSSVHKNDRVIEVNGVNVCNEAHKQVVARIKEHTDKVTLLLMDPPSERKYLENGIVIRSEMDIVEKHGFPAEIPHNITNGNAGDLRHETPAASAADAEEEIKAEVIDVEEPEKSAEPEEVIEVQQPEEVIEVEQVEENNYEAEEVTKEIEELAISETSKQSEMEDLQKETTQEEGLDASSEHESGSYEVADTAERLKVEETTTEAVEEVTATETVEEVKQEEVKTNGIVETTESVAENHTTHQMPSAAPVNGNIKSDSANETIFGMSAVQARAAQSRSRRRAIKETKQTFKEKYLVFESL